MVRYRVTISGKDYNAMADLMLKHKIGVFRHTTRQLEEERYKVDAIIDSEQISILEDEGYQIECHEDVDEVGKARLAEVSTGEDYERPDSWTLKSE